MKLLAGVAARAVFSPCGRYRYALSRSFPEGRRDRAARRLLVWLMLNPSTATAEVDDPTIRRTQTFSRAWGYDGVLILNLFAWRATDPAELYKVEHPVGPDNDATIRRVVGEFPDVVCAWGAEEIAVARARAVLALLPRPVFCLGTTKSGQPRHPLYLPASTALEVFHA